MKIIYDDQVDALYIGFLETTVTTQHVSEGLAADYDASGKLAGIEVLDVTQRLGLDTLKQITLEGISSPQT